MNVCRHARLLLAAFEAQLGPLADVETCARSWASATFAGTRHSVSFVVGPAADIEAFRRAIEEADIALPRAFVADVAVASVTQSDDTKRRVVVEALVIDEA